MHCSSGGYLDPSAILIFGAGASYGSGGLWNRPPLGKDLLEFLSRDYPHTWGQIPADIQTAFVDPERGTDFERGMSELYKRQIDGEIFNLADLLKDMARFFSHFRIDRYENNQYYKILARFRTSILERRIILATLNYDCLIEYAASAAGMETVYWGDFLGPRLLKLHGSCNFILPGVSGQGKVILSSGTFNGPVSAVDPQSVDRELDNRPIPPVMSLFNVEKTDIICPDKLLDIRKEYEEFIKQTDLAIAVGVRPRLVGDDHVWNPLKSMVGRLGIVDKSELVEEWRTKHRDSGDDPILPETFIESFPHICSLLESVL